MPTTSRRSAWTLPLLALLWMAWPTQARCETPSPAEQIVSSIDAALWYPGSAVQDALRQVIQIGQEEGKRTAEEAVKAAVTPLLAEAARLTVERDGFEKNWHTSVAALQRTRWVWVGVGLGGTLVGAAVACLALAVAK
jgi:hypothetical protein